ncbi:MAG: hypothetical protein ISS33_05280 [Candidatus Omnitrophica bacterium]|nr:hypothetical protein [Candidatus Omnitrophota bacterium]
MKELKTEREIFTFKNKVLFNKFTAYIFKEYGAIIQLAEIKDLLETIAKKY